jgi:DNA-binding NarL/FixJ family response regulator
VESTIRILVADDHTVFREGLLAVLGRESDMEVVGEAATGKEVLERATELRPDVILMDLQMPNVNGIEATRRLLETNPHVGVVVLTMFEDDDSVFSAMRAGARGYVLKVAEPAEILKVVRAVAVGDAYFGAEIARHFMDFFSAPKPASPEEAFPELTSREVEILDLIAQGHTNAKIAARLFVSPNTVRNHISHIFGKLQVADRSHAIVRAREACRPRWERQASRPDRPASLSCGAAS